MKTFIIAPILLLMVACGKIPGTYANRSQSQYSVANDTLVIDDHYNITEKTGYRRLPNGPWEHAMRHLTGTWDGHQIHVDQTGLIYKFKGDSLYIGTNSYHKL